MIVIDASALLEVLLRTKKVPDIESRIFAAAETLHAPHVIDVEVAQVLRCYWLARDIEEDRARAALADLADFPVRRYPHTFALSRLWVLRANLTAYDAAYVALAESLDASLVTCDAKLARTKGHGARILLIR